MTSNAFWKRILAKCRKPWIMTLGGLVLGLLGAGVFLVLIHYVIQPKMSIETQDIYAVRGERFNVWYRDGSPHRTGYDALYARLEESLDDLAARLEVPSTQIPCPIDVLVHDSTTYLQGSIARRKSPLASHTFYAVLDLLAGEDPYSRMAELVLAFGWGECFSQLLYDTVLTIVANPDRNPHAALAAAPPRLRYSFEELLRLDEAGEFTRTLYQRYDSPHSPTIALGSIDSIAAFYTFFSTEGALGPQESFPSLQAASLVAYLVACNGGLAAVKAVWGPGSSAALLGRLACVPTEELTEAWWQAASDAGAAAPEYDYYRARALFELGRFDEARHVLEVHGSPESNVEDLALGVRCAIALGRFGEAAALVEGVPSAPEQVRAWIDLFNGWNEVEADGIRVLGSLSREELDRSLDEARDTRDRVAAQLELTEAEIPRPMTLFLYADAPSRNRGRSVTSDSEIHRNTWHLVIGEDIAAALAATIPSYAYRQVTASSLLRAGVAAALTTDTGDLRDAGCAILEANNWTPLWQLGFGGVAPQVLAIETGLMVRQLVDLFEWDLIAKLWRATARLGGGMSFDTALFELAETSRRDIELTLLNSVLVCGSEPRGN